MSAATYRGDLTRCGRCQHKKPADGWRLCAACKELHKVFRKANRYVYERHWPARVFAQPDTQECE